MEARWWWCSAATAYLWRHRPPWGVVPAINTISLNPVSVCYCWRSCVKNFTLSRCRSAGFTRSDFQRKKKNKGEREKKKINNISCDGCACAGSFRLQIDDQRIDNDAASTLNTWNISVSIDFDGSSHTRELEKAVNEPKHMKSIPIPWKQEKKTFTVYLNDLFKLKIENMIESPF